MAGATRVGTRRFSSALTDWTRRTRIGAPARRGLVEVAGELVVALGARVRTAGRAMARPRGWPGQMGCPRQRGQRTKENTPWTSGGDARTHGVRESAPHGPGGGRPPCRRWLQGLHAAYQAAPDGSSGRWGGPATGSLRSCKAPLKGCNPGAGGLEHGGATWVGTRRFSSALTDWTRRRRIEAPARRGLVEVAGELVIELGARVRTAARAVARPRCWPGQMGASGSARTADKKHAVDLGGGREDARRARKRATRAWGGEGLRAGAGSRDCTPRTRPLLMEAQGVMGVPQWGACGVARCR